MGRPFESFFRLEFLKEAFDPSLPSGTLFQAISNGVTWGEATAVLEQAGLESCTT